MAITVEDGTGLPNADALISVAYADSYHTTRGNTTWTGTDADKEKAIVRATFYLTDSFDWLGNKVNARSQALAFPRYGLTDEEGYAVASDAVPDEIQRACAELALRELVTPGTLTPDVTAGDAVKREKIGQIEVEYVSSRTDAASQRPQISIVGPLIKPFLNGGATSNRLVGRTVRA